MDEKQGVAEISDAGIFPKFYRKMGRCIKREGATKTQEILIPESGKKLPLCNTPVVYPSPDRLDETVADMEVVDEKIFISYMVTFYRTAGSNYKRLQETLEAKTLK